MKLVMFALFLSSGFSFADGPAPLEVDIKLGVIDTGPPLDAPVCPSDLDP